MSEENENLRDKVDRVRNIQLEAETFVRRMNEIEKIQKDLNERNDELDKAITPFQQDVRLDINLKIFFNLI